MKITSIEPQKRKDRFNIFLDGEFAFGLFRDTIYNFGLRVNDELIDDKIKEICEYDEINYGKRIAYRFLNYKSRTEYEVIKKLREKKISELNVNKIISGLKDLGFINDENFTKMYVETKINLKPQGKKVLKLKLSGKGINKNISEKILDEKYTYELELNNAIELMQKYEKTVRAKNDFEKKQKVYRHLLSKGFSYDLINDAFYKVEKEK